MADDKKKKSGGGGDESVVNVPVFSYVLRLCLRMLYVALFAGFICMVIELVLYAFNNDLGYQPAFDRYQAVANIMAMKNSTLLNEVSVLNAFTEEVNALMSAAKGGVSEYFSYMDENADTSSLDKFPIQQLIIKGATNALEYAPNVTMIWLFVTMTWVAKMLTIIAMIIPCLLLLLAGVADGLAARKIAMFRGVRDSIDRFEYWMYATRSFFYIIFFFYLAIPNSIGAYQFMVPMACLTALLVRQVITNFKKYG